MDLGRWGDGREMDEWNKERKKGKEKKMHVCTIQV